MERKIDFQLDSLVEYSEEAILQELRRVAAFHDPTAPFTSGAFRRLRAKVSYHTVKRRFGSWRRGLEVAGLAHLYQQRTSGTRYSKEECFENLVNVWTHYGRIPRHDDMNIPPSSVGSKAYIMRWGTWRKALQAFVQWAHSDSSDSLPETTTLADLQQPRSRSYRDVRPGLRFKVLSRDRFRCLGCGRSPATHLNVELHVDHIMAVANGGTTVMENLQTLCKDCNLGKGRTEVNPAGVPSIELPK